MKTTDDLIHRLKKRFDDEAKRTTKWLMKNVKPKVIRWPYLTSVIVTLLYLIIFQFTFVKGGDAWAESYAEYLDEAVRLGWSEVIAQNWAGYLTIIPSFLSELYVSIGGPLGFADYYFRAVVIIFTVLSAALIAAPFNRKLIKSDAIRVFLALAVVASLTDVASFSFINVWYVGFIPIILFCLNPSKLGKKTELGLGIYGALISLTKPLIILLPLILYRLLKTRQYLGSGILLTATFLQSYQIIFNDKRKIVENSSFSVESAIGAVFTGATTAVGKLFHLLPTSIFVLLVFAFLLALLIIYIWKTVGLWPAGLISLVFLFSVYTYTLSPDLPAYSNWRNFEELSNFNLKTQREILINASILTALCIAADQLFEQFPDLKSRRTRLRTAPILFLVGLLAIMMIYRPIDTNSAGVTNVPLNSFRNQLNARNPSCVPLSPTTLFYEHANWGFSYKGHCKTLTHDLNLYKPNFASFERLLDSEEFEYDTKYFRLDKARIQAIVIPVIELTDLDGAEVQLYEKSQKRKLIATVPAGKIGTVKLLTFNVSELRPAPAYDFSLTGHKSLHGTSFSPGNELVTYPYFLDSKPL
jgi:hypothetical protein